MIELFVFWTIGIVSGIATGILPGFGPLSLVILFYPVLMSTDVLSVMLFYSGMLVAAQYTGAVVGVVAGVPGEISSTVAATSGHKLFKKGKGFEALGISAIGGTIASLTAVFLIPVIANLFYNNAKFYSIFVQVFIFLSIIILMIVYNKNYLVNLILIAFGFALGSIGYHPNFGSIMTFNSMILDPGISISVFLFCIFIVPQLLMFGRIKFNTDNLPGSHAMRQIVKLAANRYQAIVRGSLLGVLLGLIPAVGTSICSNVAAFVERRINRQQSRQLASAESANNSSAISSMIPLVAFGIPITASEMVIYNVISTSTPSCGYAWFNSSVFGNFTNLDILLYSLVIGSVIMTFVAWNFASTMIKIISKISFVHLYSTVVVIIVGAIVYQAIDQYRMYTDFISLLVLLPIGWICYKKNIDTLPAVLAFMIAKPCLSAMSVAVQLLN
jgi:putative tricarboxylic transport membrane protein